MTTYPDHCCTVHAELACILLANTGVKGGTMYIARASEKSHISRPCPACQTHMRLAGIKRMVYHDGNRIVGERI